LLDIAGMSSGNVVLYDRIKALGLEKTAAEAQATTKLGLERQILELNGDTAALRLLDIAGMSSGNVVLYDRIKALGLEKTAAEAAAAAALTLANTNRSWQDQADVLTGKATERSIALRDAGDNSTRALMGIVHGLQDLKTAADIAAAAAAEQTSTALGFQRQILELNGDTAALRLLDIVGMDARNVALYDQIAAIKAAQTAEQTLATARKDAADAARGATDNAFSGLQRAIDAQKRAVQITVDAASEQVSSIKSVFDALKSSVQDLYGQANSAARASGGQAFITQALATVQASGYLPDSAELSDAISAAMSGLSDDNFASAVDQQRSQLVLAGKLSELQGISGSQLSSAEQALRNARDQLDALDAQTKLAQDQIDALRGVDSSVLSVAQAVASLAAAMGAERAAVSAAAASPTTAAGASAAATDPYKGMISRLVTSGAQDKASAYKQLLGAGLNDSAIRKLAEQQVGAQSQADWDYLKKLAGVPGFAVGTNFVPREMIVPAAYNPATSGIGGGNTERLERLVEVLTAEVQRLQSIVATGNRHAERTAAVLDDAARGKQPLSTAA